MAFDILDIAASAMSAQSTRLSTVASNLANADSVTSSDGQPYKPKFVVFSAEPVAGNSAVGVKVQKVVEDSRPPIMKYEPAHPMADENGYIALPPVSSVDSVVDMISATRAYQANVDVANSATSMYKKALTILQQP